MRAKFGNPVALRWRRLFALLHHSAFRPHSRADWRRAVDPASAIAAWPVLPERTGGPLPTCGRVRRYLEGDPAVVAAVDLLALVRTARRADAQGR